ncbi:MAG: hypothetical protein J1F05_04160 [Muribaculaceae bacterium]|nr:hypothetical protein [Muribaculaceae bacterium]
MKRSLMSSLKILSMAILPSLFMAGCADDAEYQLAGLGEKVHGIVSIQMGASDPVTVSRAIDFSPNALVKIDSYWLALFDTNTGELLGMKYDTHPRKSDGTRHTLNSGSTTPFTVEDVEIYYYDQNPNAYIVGVINYNNVLAKNVGDEEMVQLIDILKDLKEFKDFCLISIDTRSADVANRNLESTESLPLMSGFYSTNVPSIHTTVTNGGGVNQDAAKTRLVGAEANSPLYLRDGAIRLQRLLSEMKYTVVPGDGVTINSLEYMIVNNPMEVYLAEHTTDQNGGTTEDHDTYLANTANSADYTDAYQDVSYRYVSRDSENKYVFTYQGYENKHWGRKWNFPSGYDQNDFLIRETRYDDSSTETGKSDVFRTLCQFVGSPYNNTASYVVLKADLTINQVEQSILNKTYRGTFYYTIHEGATSRPDGSVNTASSRGYDYQRIRNTHYDYTIYINGVDDLIVQANSKEDVHNDGISGTAWETQIVDVTENLEWGMFELSFDSAAELDMMTWRLWDKTPEGEFNYGNWKANPSAPSGFPAWPSLTERSLNSYFPSSSSLNYYVQAMYMPNYPSNTGSFPLPLNELNSEAHPEFEYPVHFQMILGPLWPDNYDRIDDYRRGLYISLNDIKDDGDGCSIVTRVVGMERGAVDNRSVLSSEGISYVPDHHYGPSLTWCGAQGVISYICWAPVGQAQYYLLQIDDREPIEVDALEYSDTPGTIGAIHYPYSVPSDMAAGFHTVSITAVGDPRNFKVGSPKVFEDRLEIASSWDFAKEPFIDWIKTYFDSYPTFYSYLEHDGLTVVGGSKGLTVSTDANNPYIQTGGSGSTGTRCFRFTVDRPGSVRVRACSSANSTDPRKLRLYQSNYGTASTVDVTSPNTDHNTNYYLTTVGDIDYPVDLVLYSDANVRIYEIQFVPYY